jgi:hypothetical protein
VSLRQVAECLQVVHSLFMKWQQQRTANVDPILVMLRRRKKVDYAGLLGQLKPLKDTLLRHVFEQRKQGITVHVFNLVVKASSLSPKLNTKHYIARCSAVKQFMHGHLRVYRMGTQESQRKPKNVMTEASDYMNLMRPLIEGPHRDRRFILNMDQTPVFFSMTWKKTLELV